MPETNKLEGLTHKERLELSPLLRDQPLPKRYRRGLLNHRGAAHRLGLFTSEYLLYQWVREDHIARSENPERKGAYVYDPRVLDEYLLTHPDRLRYAQGHLDWFCRSRRNSAARASASRRA